MIETVKHEIKKQERGFLGAMMVPIAASLIPPMVSLAVAPSLMNAITGRGAMRAGKIHKSEFLPLSALPLMMKALGKGVTRARIGYLDYMPKFNGFFKRQFTLNKK